MKSSVRRSVEQCGAVWCSVGSKMLAVALLSYALWAAGEKYREIYSRKGDLQSPGRNMERSTVAIGRDLQLLLGEIYSCPWGEIYRDLQSPVFSLYLAQSSYIAK